MPQNDFYDVAHANLRLSNTIVRINNYPVFVIEVREDWTVAVQYLGSGKIAELSDIRNLKGLDISPVPLGFCQNGHTTSYLMRMPRRRTKQGLAEDSIATHDGNGNSVRRSNAYSKALDNTITGVYPTLKAALSMINAKGFASVGISRNWAIGNAGDMIYFMYKYYGKVGILKDNRFILDEEYSYLQECLDQEIGNA